MDNPLKLNPSIVDAIREELNEIKNTDTLTTGKKALAEENEIIQEPHFSISIEKPKTDLTSEMLATADKWECPTSSTQSTREILEYLSRNGMRPNQTRLLAELTLGKFGGNGYFTLNKWVEIGNGCMFRPEMPELMGLLLDAFGLMCSSTSNSANDGKLAYVPALEDVLVWDIGKKTIDTFTTGYAGGSIRLRSASTSAVVVGLNGPKKAFTPRYHSKKLVPDWCRVLKIPSPLFGTYWLELDCSDTFIKLWDLSTQHYTNARLSHRYGHSLSITTRIFSLLEWRWRAQGVANKLYLPRGWDEGDRIWRDFHDDLSPFELPTAFTASGFANCTPSKSTVPCRAIARSLVEIFRDEVRKKQVRRQKRDEEKGKAFSMKKQVREEAFKSRMIPPSPSLGRVCGVQLVAIRRSGVEFPGRSLKVWNSKTTLHQPFSSLDLLYFAKIAVGTKSGDIPSSALIDTVKSHEGALWSMLVHLDGKALARISKGDRGHSHYLWTASKDKLLKYWGGDKFPNWCRSVSSVDTLARSDAPIGSGVADAQVEGAEAGIVSKQTSDTLMAGERIIEAIEVADHERETFRAYYEVRAASRDPESLPVPGRHAILAAPDISPEMYVLRVVEKVRSTVLFDALLVLPFGKVVSVLEYLNEWALR
ncbi:hypothetical protein BS47DRAFT_1370006, partial [Hydnum rufescens UP504]